MLKPGIWVKDETDMRENPWAEAGFVLDVADMPGSDVQLALVQWAGSTEPVWLIGWSLRQVDGHGHSSIRPDNSPRDEQRILSAELAKM